MVVMPVLCYYLTIAQRVVVLLLLLGLVSPGMTGLTDMFSWFGAGGQNEQSGHQTLGKRLKNQFTLISKAPIAKQNLI